MKTQTQLVGKVAKASRTASMSRPHRGPIFEIGISTPDGEFVAGYSEKGLCRLDFPSRKARKIDAPAPVPASVRSWHALTKKALLTALAGKVVTESPPLDFSSGTTFQQSVWKGLTTIARGQTTSYGRLARKIGRPRAVRALGGACGANPIPVLVPCHRVLAANQGLGGFSGGLDWKRKLLAREGCDFKA